MHRSAGVAGVIVDGLQERARGDQQRQHRHVRTEAQLVDQVAALSGCLEKASIRRRAAAICVTCDCVAESCPAGLFTVRRPRSNDTVELVALVADHGRHLRCSDLPADKQPGRLDLDSVAGRSSRTTRTTAPVARSIAWWTIRSARSRRARRRRHCGNQHCQDTRTHVHSTRSVPGIPGGPPEDRRASVTPAVRPSAIRTIDAQACEAFGPVACRRALWLPCPERARVRPFAPSSPPSQQRLQRVITDVEHVAGATFVAIASLEHQLRVAAAPAPQRVVLAARRSVPMPRDIRRKIGHGHFGAHGERDRLFHHACELPHIARPVIRDERLHRGAVRTTPAACGAAAPRKCSTSSGMSCRRSRSDGTWSSTPGDAVVQVGAKAPGLDDFHAVCRFVAATTRTSTWCSTCAADALHHKSWSTRRSLACAAARDRRPRPGTACRGRPARTSRAGRERRWPSGLRCRTTPASRGVSTRAAQFTARTVRCAARSRHAVRGRPAPCRRRSRLQRAP